jgi:2-polyprenyl-3-methyl-5-hydroxy-6-metoxy-1,4-benzoquinol methylase
MNNKLTLSEVKALAKEEEWNHYYNFDGIETKSLPKGIGGNIKKWNRIKSSINLEYLKNKKVLDIGCSDGYFSHKISEYTYKKVCGVDLNRKRIKKAKFAGKILNKKNIFLACNLNSTYLKKFKPDVILALGVLHRLPDVYGFLEKCSNLSNHIILEFKSYDSNEPVCKYVGTNKSNLETEIFYFAPTNNFVVKVLKK